MKSRRVFFGGLCAAVAGVFGVKVAAAAEAPQGRILKGMGGFSIAKTKVSFGATADDRLAYARELDKLFAEYRARTGRELGAPR